MRYPAAGLKEPEAEAEGHVRCGERCSSSASLGLRIVVKQ
jgi:hypothetical protein